MTLLSWNVQGLGGDKFHKVKGLFNQELSSQYVGKYDILLIQEHHLFYFILQGSRAQFIVSKLLKKKVGFFNVYAPNSATRRAQFWCQLWNDLLIMDHWCVVENFNMLEDPSNSMGGSTITISGAELAEWEILCFKFSLQDLSFMQSFARRVE